MPLAARRAKANIARDKMRKATLHLFLVLHEMEGDSTHFNAIVVGTGLTESILSACAPRSNLTTCRLIP